MKTRGIVAALVLAGLMASCGADAEGAGNATPTSRTSADDAATPESAASSAAPDPAFVENETCRKRVADFVAVADTLNKDSLTYGTFSTRHEEMSRTVDRTTAACGQNVEAPLRKAMYKYALADVQWIICDDGGECDMDELTKYLVAGNSLVTRAGVIADRIQD